MPRHCCAPGCKSNYDSEVMEHGRKSTFKLPLDPVLRQIWIRAIPRDNWKPSAHTAICSEHFLDTDIIRFETFLNKDGMEIKLPLRSPKLVAGAVPHIFKNLPAYLSLPSSSTKRTEPEKRRKIVIDRHEKKCSEFLNSDLIKDYKDVVERMKENLQLDKWSYKVVSKCVYFYILNIDLNENFDGMDCGVKVNCSVMINNDLFVTVFVQGNLLSAPDLQWILPQNLKLSRWSQIENILSRYNTSVDIIPKSEEYFLTLACKYVDKAIEVDSNSNLAILKNQLELFNAKRRRYSIDTIIFSFLIYYQSHASYNALKNFLILPSKRYLQQISSSLNISPETDINNKHYLSFIAKTTCDREKYVALLIDEIYVNSGLHYKAKHVTGYAN